MTFARLEVIPLKVFLSSTFRDLMEERQAVLEALRKKRMSTLAMEDFLATPSTPLETALDHLRNSDVMILVIGFEAGTLLPDGSGSYTAAEYEEILKLGKEVLVFVKQERRGHQGPSWHNDEDDGPKRAALDIFKQRVGHRWTWDTFIEYLFGGRHRFAEPDGKWVEPDLLAAR